jgi:hypothetical protein
LRRALAEPEDDLNVVVARTHEGSGVSFMEDGMEWRYGHTV